MTFPSPTPNCHCDHCDNTRRFLMLVADMELDDQEFLGMVYTKACLMDEVMEARDEPRTVQRPRWLRGRWR